MCSFCAVNGGFVSFCASFWKSIFSFCVFLSVFLWESVSSICSSIWKSVCSFCALSRTVLLLLFCLWVHVSSSGSITISFLLFLLQSGPGRVTHVLPLTRAYFLVLCEENRFFYFCLSVYLEECFFNLFFDFEELFLCLEEPFLFLCFN